MALLTEGQQTRQIDRSGGSVLRNRAAALFLAPASIFIIIFLIVPGFWTLYLGFTDASLTGVAAVAPEFLGLENYQNALQDPEFYSSLRLTAIFVFFSAIIGQAALGFWIAWVFSTRPKKIRSLIEVILIIAWIIPGSVVSFLWYAFLSDNEGTLNTILGTQIVWLLDYPMEAIIVFNTWRGLAFSVLLFGAAIAAIPRSHLEVARVAGASKWRQLRDIVIPSAKGYIITNILLISLWTFNLFTPYLLTGGGPGNETQTLPIYVFNVALRFFEFGKGSAIAAVMLLINLAFALIVIQMRKRNEARNG